MSIYYYCRHCGYELGKVHKDEYNSLQFVLYQLSDDERMEILEYHSNGNVRVKTICESCQHTLEMNPEYHQYDTFLQ